VRRVSEVGPYGLNSPPFPGFPVERLGTLPTPLHTRLLPAGEAQARASAVSGPFSAPPGGYLPLSAEELPELLRWSWEERVPLVPRAGGTGMPGGNLGPGLIIELLPSPEPMRWLDERSGRLRVPAGQTGRAIAAMAATRGRFLPFLPSSGPWCRIEGMVANNAAGAWSFRYGSISAWVEAIEGVFAWGEPFRVGRHEPVPAPFPELARKLEHRFGTPPGDSVPLPGWPAVRKNSSGYPLDRFLAEGDPTQLLVGSEGTLGMITAVELVLPRQPTERVLALIPVDSLEELSSRCEEIRALEADCCEFLGERLIRMAGLDRDPEVAPLVRGSAALLMVELSGEGADLTTRAEALRRLGRGGAIQGGITTRGVQTSDPVRREALWQIRHAASPTIAREAAAGRVSTQFIEDSVVPPAALAPFLRELDRILEEAGLEAVIFGHAGDGHPHVNPLIDLGNPAWRTQLRTVLERTVELVAGLGGTLSGEHGDGRLRSPYVERMWSPELVAAFRQVRTAFDPRGTLNPGVILPEEGFDPLEMLTPRPRSHPHHTAAE